MGAQIQMVVPKVILVNRFDVFSWHCSADYSDGNFDVYFGDFSDDGNFDVSKFW